MKIIKINTDIMRFFLLIIAFCFWSQSAYSSNSDKNINDNNMYLHKGENHPVNGYLPPPLFVDAGPVQIICNSQSALLNAIATGGTTPYSYIWSNGATTQSILVNPTLPTTYYVTVTDATMLSASDQVFVIVNQSPQVYLGANQNVCEGSIVTLQETIFGNYFWSTGSTTNSIQVSSTGNYSLTVTDSNGCSGEDYILVTFHSAPVVNLGPDQTIPFGNSTILNAGGGYQSYSWSTGASTQTINVSSSGTYSVTVTSAYGCIGSDAIAITISPPVFSANIGADQIICSGQFASFTSAQVNGQPPYSYLWSSGQTTQVIIVSPVTTTVYTVTVTDANSSQATDNAVVTVNQSPIVNLGPNKNICQGNSTTLSYSGSGTYLWSTGASTNSIQVSTNGIYSLSVTGSNGCTGSDNVQVTVNPLPVVDLGPDIFINAGDNAVLDAGPGFSAYLWSTGTMAQTISVNTTGTYSVSVTNSYGCGNSNSIQVTVVSLINPGWTNSYSSTNHSIVIPNVSNLTINGNPLEVGDYIGVFYDSLGTLACSGYIIWNGQMSGIAAWGEELGNDGFVAGEEFKWKIWQASTNTIFDAIATYMNGTTFPDAQYFVINGASGLESLTAPATQTQTINLPFGWSIFSTYIIPDNPNIADVLSDIITNVQLVKNGNGQVFWPAYSLNLIGNTVIGDGYQIKLSTLQTITVSGTAVIPENNPINIPSGWSIIGYLRQTPAPIVSILSSFVTSVQLAKNGAGQVYWPAYGLDLIGNMNPGEGYQIKLSSAQILIYPANTIQTE